MRELIAAIPDVEFLLALEPEELGAKLLFLVRAQQKPMFHPNSLADSIWDRSIPENQQYPRQQKHEIDLALTEAWLWLEAQGLIVPAPDGNGRNGYRVLSRRGRKYESEAEFANFTVARRLPKETLHPRISGSVWMSFMRGEFDVAVFQATKAIEVYVREVTGLVDELGTKLMRRAFDKNTGSLTDLNADEGEL